MNLGIRPRTFQRNQLSVESTGEKPFSHQPAAVREVMARGEGSKEKLASSLVALDMEAGEVVI
jgi:hypothetical protein